LIDPPLIDRPLIDRPAPDAPSVARLVDGYWTECRARAMGSTAHVLIGDAPEGVAAWALAEIERLEQCWSRFRQDSELAQLHERADRWTQVSPPMLLALTCATDLHRATQGRFDPTILDALERVGYDRSFETVEPDSDGRGVDNAYVPAAGFDRVEIDVDSACVRIPAGVRIDLGGLGKGLAADLVSRGLIDRGVRTALVSLGGDLRARGEPPDGAWRIPVEHPLDPTRVAFVHALRDDALVASTRRIRAWTRADREYHHIIDPRTGDSTRTPVVAVVAAAAESWWAEGIAKAMMIAGIDDGRALAGTARVHAWMYLDDGQVIEAGP
jgi:thiamine biosynthesis lipoprotein